MGAVGNVAGIKFAKFVNLVPFRRRLELASLAESQIQMVIFNVSCVNLIWKMLLCMPNVCGNNIHTGIKEVCIHASN